MSRPVLYAPAAENDLGEIGEWISDAAGTATAIAYVRRIRAKCAKLAGFPGIGTPRPGFGANIRSLPYGPYLIFYGTADRVTIILRVIHSSRDIRSIRFD